ncbi:hypothetical protein GJAV_G00248480 [Gymnothorax javanicus]|nr:hypothetical protein GJAV_G00248480 [Gymnothorax javanicus]
MEETVAQGNEAVSENSADPIANCTKTCADTVDREASAQSDQHNEALLIQKQRERMRETLRLYEARRRQESKTVPIVITKNLSHSGRGLGSIS